MNMKWLDCNAWCGYVLNSPAAKTQPTRIKLSVKTLVHKNIYHEFRSISLG